MNSGKGTPGKPNEISGHRRGHPPGELQPKLQTGRSLVVWSIAGFDPSSGAGVSADTMTFAAHGMFGCAAITATTIQNTRGVFGVMAADPGHLRATLDRLMDDLPPVGVKIGMLGTQAIAEVVIGWLQEWRRSSKSRGPVVLDPVLRSSSGAALYPDEGLPLFRDDLLPLVDWITPNWSEIAVLAQRPVNSLESAVAAAAQLAANVPHLGIVATGGDQDLPVDLLFQPGLPHTALAGRHIRTTSTHGTGCAFSSALLCQLVRGQSPGDAVQDAKRFVEGALERAPGLGSGRGPMELLWPLL